MAAHYHKRVFKAVNQKIQVVDQKTGETKTRTKVVYKEGINGTGITLPFICGFCKDRDGNPTFACRTRKERNRHANFCSDKG